MPTAIVGVGCLHRVFYRWRATVIGQHAHSLTSLCLFDWQADSSMHFLVGFALFLGILWVLTATVWGRRVLLVLAVAICGLTVAFFHFAGDESTGSQRPVASTAAPALSEPCPPPPEPEPSSRHSALGTAADGERLLGLHQGCPGW